MFLHIGLAAPQINDKSPCALSQVVVRVVVPWNKGIIPLLGVIVYHVTESMGYCSFDPITGGCDDGFS